MVRYKISYENRHNLNENRFIKYSKYEIDTISNSNINGEDYFSIKFHCDETLENEQFFNGVQPIMVTTQLNEEGRVYSNIVECKLTTINHRPYFIEGIISNRSKLLYDDFYISSIDNMLYFRFNEPHCIKYDNSIVKIYVNIKNIGEVTLNCVYVDDYTVSVKENDFDRMLFDTLYRFDIESVYRDNFILNADSINLPSNVSGNFINIPIMSSSVLQLGGGYNKIIEDSKKQTISFYTETEKDKYELVNKNGDKYIDIVRIRFNLHLLKRNGENWLLSKYFSWNGVKEDYTFDENYFVKGVSKSNQSDLLGSLGFTNDDVLYGKNNIKKSFLRLSFYDSPNLERGNLLAYNTITFNEQDLLSKFIKNRYNGVYKEYREEIDEYKERLGISVNSNPLVYNKTNDNRLSCVFEVRKDDLVSGCEGINLYLHKLFNNDLKEKDVYLRVEFNHAKFGRTIPLMLPYNKNGNIKTFEEIIIDHKDNGGYSLNDFNEYFNIKMKIKNDFDNNRFVYYFDKNEYSDISFEDGVLTLNLYEGKVSKTIHNNEINEDVIFTVNDYSLKYNKKTIDKDDSVVLYSPIVKYRQKEVTNKSKRVISDRIVVSNMSSYNILINPFNVEEIDVTDKSVDISSLVEGGKKYILKQELNDYILYNLCYFNYVKVSEKLCSVIVSKKSGKIEISGLSTLKKELGLTDKYELARITSKDIVDGKVYVSNEISLKI